MADRTDDELPPQPRLSELQVMLDTERARIDAGDLEGSIGASEVVAELLAEAELLRRGRGEGRPSAA